MFWGLEWRRLHVRHAGGRKLAQNRQVESAQPQNGLDKRHQAACEGGLIKLGGLIKGGQAMMRLERENKGRYMQRQVVNINQLVGGWQQGGTGPNTGSKSAARQAALVASRLKSSKGGSAVVRYSY